MDGTQRAAFRRGIGALCELYFAAGARVVYPPVERVAELRDGDLEPLRRAEVRPRDLTLAAFHPLQGVGGLGFIAVGLRGVRHTLTPPRPYRE